MYRLDRGHHPESAGSSTTTGWRRVHDGLEIDRRQSATNRGLDSLAGYTLRAGRGQDLSSLASPNALINAEGESGGRRHLFKVTGCVHVAVRDPVRRELPVAVRAAVQPDVHRAAVHGNGDDQTVCRLGSTTIFAEPRGSRQLLVAVDDRSARRPGRSGSGPTGWSSAWTSTT